MPRFTTSDGIGIAYRTFGDEAEGRSDHAALLERPDAPDPSSVENPTLAAFLTFIDAVGGDRLALAAQARSVHREPIALDRITAPTLLVTGADDELASRPEVLAAAIPGARSVEVPGDHMGALMGPDYLPLGRAFLAEP